MAAHRSQNLPPDAETVHYRIVLDEALGASRTTWFEEAIVSHEAGRTVIDVAVPDQAALHGILRRIHDLHLKLVSVERIDTL